jgi:hypothetical protein
VLHSKLRCLPLMLGLLAAGCSLNASAPKRAEVSGTVSFQGKPLPGGIITFISDKGFLYSANIDENGHYSIEVGIGPNKISVDNRLLMKNQKGTGPRLKSPEVTPQNDLTGTYVPIKERYVSTETSGLEYTVSAGTQVKDFTLQN